MHVANPFAIPPGKVLYALPTQQDCMTRSWVEKLNFTLESCSPLVKDEFAIARQHGFSFSDCSRQRQAGGCCVDRIICTGRMIVARSHDLDRGFMTIAMHAWGLLPQIYDVRGGLTRSADYRNAANSNFSTRMRIGGSAAWHLPHRACRFRHGTSRHGGARYRPPG